MSSEIVNMTRKLVNQKVEELIKNPRSTYDSAFLNTHLRQKLIVKVLNQVLPQYGVSDETSEDSHLPPHGPGGVEQEQKIEHLIENSVYPVLQEENALPYFPAEAQPSVSEEPSHWFG